MSCFKALYLHIPFCKSKCIYCDFDSSPLARAGGSCAIDAYVRELMRRLASFGEAGELDGIETVYIGGGTPSVLGPRLVDLAREVCRWCAPAEFTCEANPESFDSALAGGLRAVGVTRISFGVQSLCDAELKAIGRLHDAAGALAAIAIARDAGLRVSADLMCGLPGQTMESWESSLARLASSGVGHVSVYPLTLEDGTPMAGLVQKGRLAAPDEDFQAACMETARTYLSEQGFAPYEVASYAKEGECCRHNIAYWTGVPYLGLGRSAAGMLPASAIHGLNSRFSRLGQAIDEWQAETGELPARVRFVQLDDEGRAFDFEFLSEREAAAEDLMLGCRLTHGISAERVRRLAGPLGTDRVVRACGRAVELGLAAWTDGSGRRIDDVGSDDALEYPSLRFAPTHEGWLSGNVLFELFWELA